MANEFGSNLNVGTSQWQAVWEWCRRMQKAGYWLRASSNGTTKVVSDDPSAHAILAPTNTANSGTAASITAVAAHPYGYLMTLAGLTGLVAPTVQGGNSEGCFLTISGAATSASNGTWQTYEVVSATSAKVLVRTGTPVAGDANNGAISWQEKDPVGTQTYTLGAALWWVCFESMETYQIRCTTAAVGTFLRGESITQSTSGATGECVGFVWDGLTNQGWMIVMPRTGVFDGSNTITGASSGATFIPTVVHKFRRQFVYSKGSSNNYTGSGWYFIMRESSAGQIAEAFSTKAASAACTATVAPGGSTTAGNRFFTNTSVTYSCYVLRCYTNATGDGVTALVHAGGIICDVGDLTSSSNGRAQVSVANIMPRAGRSADGTTWVFHGHTGASPAGSGALQGWFRVDAGDDGEPELLYHFAHASNTANWQSRWSNDGGFNYLLALGPNTFMSVNDWTSWCHAAACAEGISGQVNNGPQNMFLHMALSVNQSSQGQGDLPMAGNWGATQRAFSHPATIPPGFKEPIAVNEVMGRLRWMYAIQQGATYQTFEGRKYFCILAYNNTSYYPGIIIGPWDQTTDPVQS